MARDLLTVCHVRAPHELLAMSLELSVVLEVVIVSLFSACMSVSF